MFEKVSPLEKILLSMLIPAFLITIIVISYTYVSTGRFAFSFELAQFLKFMLALVAISTIGLVARNIWASTFEKRRAAHWQDYTFTNDDLNNSDINEWYQ